MTQSPHSVLIPIANPGSAPQFLHLGARIARKHGSDIVLLHVSSPEGEEEESVLEEARSLAEPLDVSVRTATRTADDVAGAIIYAAQEEKTSYLIMGWRGDLRGGKTVIGENIDRVIKEAGSHAIVMQQGSFKEEERILVPVANPRAAPLALAMASLLRGEAGPAITLLHLCPRSLNDKEKESFRSALFSFVEQNRGDLQKLVPETDQFELVFEQQEDPARELSGRSTDYDRLVLGTSREGYFGGEVFGELLLKIGREAKCPVVFVRSKKAGASFRF